MGSRTPFALRLPQDNLVIGTVEGRTKDPVSSLARTTRTDVALVGAGIMSATLGALLRRLQPDWSMTLVERLDAVAAESSSPWNNAGTGHSALCELNYTPQQRDGSIDICTTIVCMIPPDNTVSLGPSR